MNRGVALGALLVVTAVTALACSDFGGDTPSGGATKDDAGNASSSSGTTSSSGDLPLGDAGHQER